jgi:hypothetical protein
MCRDEVGTPFNVFRRFREAVLQRNETRQILIDYWMDTRIQAWEMATASNLWRMSNTVKNRSRKLAWAVTYCRPYLGYMGHKMRVAIAKRKPLKCYNVQRG